MTPLIRGSSRINGQQLRSRVLNPHVLRTPKLIYGYSPAHPGSSQTATEDDDVMMETLSTVVTV